MTIHHHCSALSNGLYSKVISTTCGHMARVCYRPLRVDNSGDRIRISEAYRRDTGGVITNGLEILQA